MPEIPEDEQTPLVKTLLALLEEFAQRIAQQDEEIAHLKDEINILKGEKKRPKFKPGKLDKETTDNANNGEEDRNKKRNKKRPGSSKRNKNSKLTIHQDEIIQPDDAIPEGSRFKGYRDFVVQDLEINVHNTRYRLARWVTPDGKTLTGQLPNALDGRHFGPQLMAYLLYQHHHCHTTQPLLLEQLREWGIDISSGQIDQLLATGKDAFHAEKDALLQAGLASSSYVTVDDSGARHQGKNGYVTQIGNDFFAWFSSTDSKSRMNFLELLRAEQRDYHLNEAAFSYMEKQKLPKPLLLQLREYFDQDFANRERWLALLETLSMTKPRHCQIATEGAVLGSVIHHGLCDDLVIVSDDAGQFNILLHGLCWVHTERLIHKLIPFNEAHREAIEMVRDQIWTFYAELKAYKIQPSDSQQDRLNRRFDEIFTQRTECHTLNRALMRINKNKAEL